MPKAVGHSSRTPSPGSSPYRKGSAASPRTSPAPTRTPSPIADTLVRSLASTDLSHQSHSQPGLAPPTEQGIQVGRGPRPPKAALSPEKKALRDATKERNAKAAAQVAAAKKQQGASKLAPLIPGHENAVFEQGRMTKCLFNMSHFVRDSDENTVIGASHGHDKAVRFAKLGYSVIETGERQPSEAARQSMQHFSQQVLEVAAKNPAKLRSTLKDHEKDMEKRIAIGRLPFAFPGDGYTIEGKITTPSGALALLKTGWVVQKPAGENGPAVPLCVSAYFK